MKNSLKKKYIPKFISRKVSKSSSFKNDLRNQLLIKNKDSIKKYSYLFADLDSNKKSLRSKNYGIKNQKISDCDLSKFGTANKTNYSTNLLTFGGEMDSINLTTINQGNRNILRSYNFNTDIKINK